ncbi:translesion error-prone DNA polymerase V autoproteolytic subunit [Pseudomonas marginalis]|uniref:Translesion error-prone DNA polymerase V autoproteolytic subunit n=1 Tax=Pseudomonas marginalis TaxID=298 RepID=A0A9X9BK91_PSEMA|nr:S24 family peptidase [Pseudomonas marginalis]TWR48081.1 translesion error-prone DNA polymerase V autoproteolytic subunit [Pseudomonas marginalis]SEB32921.1 DNA polymerase V [Pseudomonas marginalis]
MSATLIGPIASGGELLPLYSCQVSAGLPSPAGDHLEKLISLNELFEIRAPHVYLAKILGDSMQGAGIFSGDLVIVDRGKTARHGDIVIAALNTESVCKRLYMRDDLVVLMAENPKFQPRYVMEGDELVIWGVVSYSVRDHEHSS